MRAHIVILALVATPFLADVSAAQGKNRESDRNQRNERNDRNDRNERKDRNDRSDRNDGNDRNKGSNNDCFLADLRKSHPALDRLLKQFDKKGCSSAPAPAPAPAPTPTPTPTPTPPPANEPATGATLQGMVYVDVDGSSLPDAGEPRLRGNAVQLMLNGAVVKSVVTDANGLYSFGKVQVGLYTVCAEAKAGYSQITPMWGGQCRGGLGYIIDVSDADPLAINVDLDFGYQAAAP